VPMSTAPGNERQKKIRRLEMLSSGAAQGRRLTLEVNFEVQHR
jgi:hypothetical protein